MQDQAEADRAAGERDHDGGEHLERLAEANARLHAPSIVAAWTTRASRCPSPASAGSTSTSIRPRSAASTRTSPTSRFSRYEFTLTFARIEHEVEEGDVPGAVVARINASPRFVEELIAALQDSWSKYQTTEGIRNLPEAPDH